MSKHLYAVVAYKESEYLPDCIASLKSQADPSPIIVCTSTPNAYIQGICEEHGLLLIHSQGTGGIDGDWNDALMSAQGEYVTLCHQDDLYEAGYGRAIKQAIDKDDKHLIVFTDYMELKGAQKSAKSKMLFIKRMLLWPMRIKPFRSVRFFKRLTLCLGNPICCPAVTYHKSALPMPLFEKRFKSNLDWQTWEKLSRMKGRFTYIPEKLMCHRLHAQSTTSELIRDNLRTEEDEAIFSLFWPKPVAKLLTKAYASSEKENNSFT